MVSSDTKLANVVGGKTSRVCDNCIRKHAKWYCAADDAFLCQSCDGLVHTANPLARRHERLRLKIVSSLDKHAPPPWHQGFIKKPRTPRKHGSRQKINSDESNMSSNPLCLVPEGGSDEPSCEEQLLNYQVPEVTTPAPVVSNHHHHGLILPSDVELAEFAADVESLLGKGVDDESFAWEGLGSSKRSVKVEEDQMQFEIMEMMGEPFELSCFDYDAPLWEEKHEKVVVKDVDAQNYNKIKKTRTLNLDVEGIIAAWDDQRSPWTTGDRPELDPDDCWPECMGGCGTPHHQRFGDMGMMIGNPAMLDGGREARVSRYREKRRTRLFSKKIRYEVRKLNAEKRPRMKGRFVKRTSSSSGFPLLSK